MALGKTFVVAARLSAAFVLLGAATVLSADLPARAEAELAPHAATANGPSILTMRVIDGDTLENTTNGIRYRLDNIDAAPTANKPVAPRSATGRTRRGGGRAIGWPRPRAWR